MTVEDIALPATLLLNMVALIIVARQTSHLAKQNKAILVSLEYTSYLKLVDYLNEVNSQIFQNERVAQAFSELDFIADHLKSRPGLTVEKVALAWMIINRYEAAMMGYKLGIIPERDWQVWIRRLSKDMRLPFIRDVWICDIQNFDYDPEFKQLVNSLL